MHQAAQGLAKTLERVELEEYLASEDTQLIVERRLEILGEAANRVSQAFKDAHPEIPWRRVISQRNFIIHEYDEVDSDRVWHQAKSHIPGLVRALKAILDNLPPEDRL
jgi:uncharacterized protein with HEPN domain